MKMIYVGNLKKKPDRDYGWIREFELLGWNVKSFSTSLDLRGNRILKKIKKRFNIGKENNALQKKLLDLALIEKPLWIHFRLPLEFDRKTILKLKSFNIIITQYFNDDPFSRKSPLGLNWKFRRALFAYDAHFVFRKHNINFFYNAGAKHVEHCPPFYNPKFHFFDKNNIGDEFIADAGFIGHWENDSRLRILEALHKLDFKIIIRGGNWDRQLRGYSLNELKPIDYAIGTEYNFIYSNVLAGLCFFSKINNDTWTRRALEIIAVGGLLVCERTKEAESYFIDRKEAYFFSSIDELVDILIELKSNPSKREKIRKAGYKRLLSGNFRLKNRAIQIDKFVQSHF